MTFQLLKRARSLLLKSTRLRKFQNAHPPYFIYDIRAALLHTIVSSSERFSYRLQRASLSRVQRRVATNKEVDKTAWGPSGVVSHSVCMLTSQSCSYLYAFLGITGLYTLDDERPLKRNAVQELQFTTPALFLVCTLLLDKAVSSLRMRKLEVERLRLKTLIDRKELRLLCRVICEVLTFSRRSMAARVQS